MSWFYFFAGLSFIASFVVGVFPNELNSVSPSNGSSGTRFMKRYNDVTFHLFTKERPNKGEKLRATSNRLFQTFNPQRPTKIVIHGWWGAAEFHYTSHMKNAFLPRFDFNVIVVDWSKVGSRNINYMTSRNEVVRVGNIVGTFIDDLCRLHGITPSSLHILGHSLGAHIAGIAARKISSGRVNRITGFDPAGVFFEQSTVHKLRSDAAEFVDVIHVSSNTLGCNFPMGHVDFYPNGGTSPQPGLPLDVTGALSHQRAHEYYIESLTNPTGFPAAQCASWDAFQRRQCDFNSINFIGENTNRGLHGQFYLRTNGRRPFARGLTWN